MYKLIVIRSFQNDDSTSGPKTDTDTEESLKRRNFTEPWRWIQEFPKPWNFRYLHGIRIFRYGGISFELITQEKFPEWQNMINQ